jgi:hypothetical protein
MQIKLSQEDGTVTNVNIGYGLIPAASEFLRKERRIAFEATLELLTKYGDPDSAKQSIIEATKDYQKTQIPTDGEIREWLVTPHGVQFAVSHGSKKSTKWTIEQAEDVLDGLNEESYISLIRAINVVAAGQEAVNYDERLRKASKAQFEKRLAEMERLAAEPIQPARQRKKREATELLDRMPEPDLFGETATDDAGELSI